MMMMALLSSSLSSCVVRHHHHRRHHIVPVPPAVTATTSTIATVVTDRIIATSISIAADFDQTSSSCPPHHRRRRPRRRRRHQQHEQHKQHEHEQQLLLLRLRQLSLSEQQRRLRKDVKTRMKLPMLPLLSRSLSPSPSRLDVLLTPPRRLPYCVVGDLLLRHDQNGNGKCRFFSSSFFSYSSGSIITVNNNNSSSSDSVRSFVTEKDKTKEQRWDTMFRRLLKYKQEHDGSTLVPQNYKDDVQLGRWVKRQRSLYKNKKLSTEHIVQLEAIQFWWDAREGLWEQCFDALLTYKRQQPDGSTLVPKRYEANPVMANWVSTQRQFYKQNLLSKERIDRLDDIGFIWDPLEQTWDEMFQQWIAEKKNSTTKNTLKDVAAGDDDDDDDTAISTSSTSTTTTTTTNKTPVSSTKLQDWIEVQRMYYVEGKLNEARYRRLCEEGFEFEPRNSSWWESYGKLERYHQQNGGRTDIPYIYDEDPQLGRWVHTQRASQKKGRLPHDRIDALDKLHFEWEIRRTTKHH